MATGRPRNPPGGLITPRMQAYLAALPLAKGSVSEACRTVSLKPNSLTKWRGRSPAFKAEEDRIRREIAEENGELGRLRTYAKNALRTQADAAGIGEGLEKWQQIYLLVYQRDRDRVKACRAAEKLWKTVKKALEEDEPFRQAVAEIEEELDIQLEDAQRRRAIDTGDPAAANAMRKAAAERDKGAKGKAGPPASRRERVERLRAEKGAVN